MGFDNTNQPFWSSYFGGKGTIGSQNVEEGEYSGGIVATPNNRLYICGETFSNLALPYNCPLTNSPYCQPYNSATVYDVNGDAFVANLIQGGTSSIAQHTKVENTVSIYPNPSTGLYTLDIEMKSNENVTFEVYNLLGEKISEQKATAKYGKNLFQLDLSKASDGIYFVNVQMKDKRIGTKIIKN